MKEQRSYGCLPALAQKHPAVFVSDHQLARIVGRAVQSLRNDRFAGKGFPFYRVGRSVRYKLDEVIGIIEQSRVEPERAGK